MTEGINQGIKIKVETIYIPERSSPEQNQYFFAYNITISNQRSETVQLLNRHWIITNGNGEKEEVQGPGVVGEQPVLKPEESFNYTSYCPLNTPIGSMHGTYQMKTEAGETFDAAIPAFTLAYSSTLLN